jgi:hypothetical protein
MKRHRRLPARSFLSVVYYKARKIPTWFRYLPLRQFDRFAFEGRMGTRAADRPSDEARMGHGNASGATRWSQSRYWRHSLILVPDTVTETMNPPCFDKIVVPHCWTGEQDIQACVGSLSEVDDYFGEALARVDAGYDRLEKSLDEALVLIGNTGCFAAHVIQRIDTLRQHFSTRSPTEAYRQRLLHYLDYCRFAVVEYFRMMPGYLHQGDLNWLFPLVHLSDHLSTAASGLSGVVEAYLSAHDVNALRG